MGRAIGDDMKNKMTVDEAITRRAEIQDALNDPELAHALEDKFHRDVFRAIFVGAEQPQALALIALSTWEIEFPRWTA